MTMRKSLRISAAMAAVALTPALAQQSPDDVARAEFPFEKRVLVDGLGNPFELRIGPDGWLWVTERTAKKLTRINPEDGAAETAFEFDMPDVMDDQTGLLGFAFHPDFGDGTDHIFVYHTYEDAERADPTRPEGDPFHRLFNKVVRLDYDAESGTLSNPTDILTGIPANNDHNSGRMQIGPDGMIYLTAGDQGHNQHANWCRPIEAQTLPTAEQIEAEDYFAYQGKVLRMNLDGGIPDDNPEIDDVRSHVFSYGHRNPQGLDFGPDGTLYSNEHGPDSDDEINVITAGGNYGWPHVAGRQDDNFYLYARWSEAEACDQMQSVGPSQGAPDSVPQEAETAWEAPENYVPPLATMFTVTEPIPGCEDFGYFCRPSVGPSSIEFYHADGVPDFSGRLLTTAMKHGSIYSFDPAAGGSEFTRYYLGANRLRDLAISEDGTTIYLATDSQGGVQNEEGAGAEGLEDPGAILVYTAN